MADPPTGRPRRRSPQVGDGVDWFSENTTAALAAVLVPGETVQCSCRAMGSTFVLTDRQLLLIREGAHWRDGMGVRAWSRDGTLRVYLTRQRGRLHLVVDGNVPVGVAIWGRHAAAAMQVCDRITADAVIVGPTAPPG